MLQIVALVILLLCWVVWMFAFAKPRSQNVGQKIAAQAPNSKWGIGLVMVSYFLIWVRIQPAGFHKSNLSLVISMFLGPPSVILAWLASRRLGKQWRFVAAVNTDHELIQSGPYRLVRHPIYLSMFGMLLATATCWTWWPLSVAAIIAFLVGTEIRVRAEDRLLADRFRDSFDAYRSRVRAYIPFIR